MLDSHWEVFADLQSQANFPVLNRRAWAVDEALDALLTDISNGKTDPERMRRRFGTLVANRCKKYRRRSQLSYNLADVHNGVDILEIVSEKKRLEAARDCLAARDWGVLTMIAGGASYKDISKRTGLTLANVKARISRARQQLRLFQRAA
jgi:DNA-binding NarL/FixJ family response regulator